MIAFADKTQENKSQVVANEISQKQRRDKSTFQFVDNQPEAITQRKLQRMANNSLHGKRAVQLQAMANRHSLQQPIQKKENNTGLLDKLKSSIENLSGYSMNDVKEHRNSDKPAQLHAHVQGTDIHLGPGQEKQGRVKPTMQMKVNLNINDAAGLEKEAVVMGANALQMKPQDNKINALINTFDHRNSGIRNGVVQLEKGDEIWNQIDEDLRKSKIVCIYGEEGGRQANRERYEDRSSSVGHSVGKYGAYGLTIDELNNVVWRNGTFGVFGLWKDAKRDHKPINLDSECLKRVNEIDEGPIKEKCKSYLNWLISNRCSPEYFLQDYPTQISMESRVGGHRYGVSATRNSTSIDNPLGDYSSALSKESLQMKDVFNQYTVAACGYGLRWLSSLGDHGVVHFELSSGNPSRAPMGPDDVAKVVSVRDVNKIPVTIVEAMHAFMLRDSLTAHWYINGEKVDPPWIGKEKEWTAACRSTEIDQLHVRAAGKSSK